jgi:hypothetical protein
MRAGRRHSITEPIMSKVQRSNKEAKKPKKKPAPAPLPGPSQPAPARANPPLYWPK